MTKLLCSIFFCALIFSNFSAAAIELNADSTKCLAYADSINKAFSNHKYKEAVPWIKLIIDCAAADKATLNRSAIILQSLNGKNDSSGLYTDDLLSIYRKLHRVQPSGNTALNLANLFSGKTLNTQASNFYKEALDLESDTTIRAEIYLAFAKHTAYKLNDFELARTNALRATSVKSAKGKALLFIGNLYAASADNCKNDSLDGRSCYWLATDKFMEAALAEPALKKNADVLIGKYSKLFPTSKEIEIAGLTPGDSISVKCWINEKTIIRPR
jgi:hypothetical protein